LRTVNNYPDPWSELLREKRLKFAETVTPEELSLREADSVGRRLMIVETVKSLIVEQLAVSPTINIVEWHYPVPLGGPLYIDIGLTVNARVSCCRNDRGGVEGRLKGTLTVSADLVAGKSVNIPRAGPRPTPRHLSKTSPTKAQTREWKQRYAEIRRSNQRRQKRYEERVEQRNAAIQRLREQVKSGQFQYATEPGMIVEGASDGNRCSDPSWELQIGFQAEFRAGVYLIGFRANAEYVWTFNQDGYQGGRGHLQAGPVFAEIGTEARGGIKASGSIEWRLLELLGEDPFGLNRFTHNG